MRLPSRSASAVVVSCLRPSLLAAVLLASSFGASGCAAQLRQHDKDLYASRTRDESDPDMKAWLKGLDDCRNKVYDTDTPVSYFAVCTPRVENEILSSMRARAAAETRPAAKAVLERAATCFEGAPSVTGRSTYNEGKNYDVVKRCFVERARDLAAIKVTVDAENAYATAEKADTVDGWMTFITARSSDKRVPVAARRVAALAATMPPDAQLAADEKLVAAYPAVAAELPPERRVLLVGPRGLRVRDIQKMTEAKVSQKIIVARINASTEPYKSFDADELVVLKNAGISDDIVAAMVEVTTKVDDRRRADEERQGLRSEIAALKAMIEKKGEGAGGKGETVQTKDGPMDVVASCAKRLGALKACDQLPFPASSICTSSAESAFPCPTKVN